jgi:DNA-binding NarL/FixJ family response regulator
MGAGEEREHAAYYKARLPRVRAALSDIQFNAAWQIGRALNREEAVVEALADDQQQTTDDGSLSDQGLSSLVHGQTTPADSLAALTAREREVALLMARGRTNEQIAGELFVTLKTVEKHAGNALRKLGFRNRQELGEWLAAQGLL